MLSRTAKKDGPVRIRYQVSDGQLHSEPQVAVFDELILAIDADSALKLLGKEASWMEKRVLGNVKYLYDVTITHNDLEYMNKVSMVFYLSSATQLTGASITRPDTVRSTTRRCPPPPVLRSATK